MSKNGPQVILLAYADNIIIFRGGNTRSIKVVMNQIQNYEMNFGQQVNGNKNFFFIGFKTSIY